MPLRQFDPNDATDWRRARSEWRLFLMACSLWAVATSAGLFAIITIVYAINAIWSGWVLLSTPVFIVVAIGSGMLAAFSAGDCDIALAKEGLRLRGPGPKASGSGELSVVDRERAS